MVAAKAVAVREAVGRAGMVPAKDAPLRLGALDHVPVIVSDGKAFFSVPHQMNRTHLPPSTRHLPKAGASERKAPR